MITTQLVHGELTIPLGDIILVQSRTDRTAWHVVKNGACDCPGYLHRHACRHLTIADEASKVPCHRCGAPARPPEPGTFPTCGKCAKALITLADD
jgi:hypothetical protein